MVKKRLSKLQRWILERCLENLFIRRDEARRFYGKSFCEHPKFWDSIIDYQHEGIRVLKGLDVNDYEQTSFANRLGEEWTGYEPKKEKCSTRAIEAAISRSFNQLVKTGLLSERDHFGKHFLTREGFLIVNKNKDSGFVNTYENYSRVLAKANEEEAEHWKGFLKDLKEPLKKIGNKP